MKREDLKKLNLTDEQIDSVMSLHGSDVETSKADLATANNTIATLTTERDGLKQQLGERDNDIKTLKEQAGNSDDLNTKLNDLQTKYNKDTTELKSQLDNQAKDFSTDKFFASYKFKSELARKAAISEFKSKDFKTDADGNFVGGKEFMESLIKSDPEAFIVEDAGNGGNGGNNGNQNSNQNGNRNGGIRLRSGGDHGNSNEPDYDSMSDEEYFAAKAKAKENSK